MHKKILILPLLIISSYISAQPIIYSSDGPKIGDHYITAINLGSGLNISPGAMGANQTWNFSNMPTNNLYDTFDTYVVAPSSTPFINEFPSANICEVYDGEYDYYENSITESNYLGNDDSTITVTYSPPLKMFAYPFYFNNSFIGNFSATVTPVYFAGFSGSSTVTADGYGTLITPAGTYHNTLRVTTTEQVTFSGSGTFDNGEFVNYSWYINKYGNPLMSITIETIDTIGGSESDTLVYYDVNVLTGISEVNTPAQLNIYPNPTTGKIFLTAEEPLSHVTVSDAVGRILTDLPQNDNVPGTTEISLADLPSGIYFVKVQATNGMVVKKIILQK
jgi:hypothetical protein